MGFSGSGSGNGSLGGATDVALNNPANNDVLAYDSSTGKWKNTVNAGGSGARTNKAATVSLAAATESLESISIIDDGSSTTNWPNRVSATFVPQTGTSVMTHWLNEYGEVRGMPGKSNTVGARWFAAADATALASRSTSIPVLEVTDKRDGTRNTMFGVYSDGATRLSGYKVTIGPTIPSSPEAGQIHIVTEI